MTVMSTTRPEPVCGMESWIPTPARILKVKSENFNTRTFTVEFVDEYIRNTYRFIPGQFNMIYAPGVGEAGRLVDLTSKIEDRQPRNRAEAEENTPGDVHRDMTGEQNNGDERTYHQASALHGEYQANHLPA